MHGSVDKIARVGKDAEHNHKDDKSGHPAPVLVGMNNFVAKEDNDKRAKGDDEDAGETWDVVVDRMDELRANDNIGGSPADTC